MRFDHRHHLELPHGSLGYRDTGDPAAATAPPLVLLHGLGGNADTWTSQIGSLGGQRRVIAWDSPGYGASDPHPTPSAQHYAQAVLALLDALELERVDLLGHSMGGVIAPRVVHAGGDRIRRLVLSATRASFAGEAAGGFAARAAELRTLSPEEFGERRALGMVASGARPEAHRAVASIAARVRLEGYLGGVEILGGTDNRSLLPEFDLPTLVLAGSEDRVAPPEYARAIAALIPGARLAIIEGAGHAAYVESPERFDALVSEFLA